MGVSAGQVPKTMFPQISGWFQIQDIQDISKNDINTVQVWDDWMVPYKNGRHSHIFVESLGHCPRWRHWKVSSDLWSTVAGADFVFCLFCRIERNSRALVLNLARCSHSAGIAFVDVNFSWQCACVALCRSASHHQPLWWLRLAWCWDEAFEKRGRLFLMSRFQDHLLGLELDELLMKVRLLKIAVANYTFFASHFLRAG